MSGTYPLYVGAAYPASGGGGGSGDMILASVQTVTGAKTFTNATLLLRNVANTFSAQFTSTITAARTYTLPDATGTIALTSDASTVITVDVEASDVSCFPAFFTSKSGNLAPKTNEGLLYNSATNALTATTFVGALTGVASGNALSSHVHGNLTNAGAIGSTANLPLITTTSGVVTVGTFGSTANTFCQGNDSRLSDSRTPVAHSTDLLTSGTLPVARGGTGLTALGTSLQVLRTNTGATALEYATITTGIGDALVANPLSQFAATTSAQLAGVISDETGSGLLVFATSPELVNPNISGNSAAVVTTIRQDGTGVILRLQRNNGGASGAYIQCDNGTDAFSVSRDGAINAANTYSSALYNVAQFCTGGESSTGWGSTGFNSKVIVAYCNSTEVARFSTAGITIGSGGTAIAKVLSATATLDFGSIAAQSYADLTVTVTGAALGDTVSIGVPNASITADISFFGWVSATNTVTIRCTNISLATARDPASGTFRATVTQF